MLACTFSFHEFNVPDNNDQSVDGISPENANHNLDMTEDETEETCEDEPERDQREADFAAEAHGFTGPEKAKRGSGYEKQDDQ